MTVSRTKGFVSFSCDGCPDGIETDERDFDSAWSAARAEGWIAIKTAKGTFEHYCTACGPEVSTPSKRMRR